MFHARLVAGTEAMDKAASAEETEQQRKVMRLHILSGSFFPRDNDNAGLGEGGLGCPMDASVWSRLPDDVMWQVLRFVPAAKQFQMHSVSHKWRRELRSPHFRNTILAAAAADPASDSSPKQHPVVACVVPAADKSCRGIRVTDAGLQSSVKVVEVDLSFVPDWFWKPSRKGCCCCASYSVVAAWDGLVCVSNNMGAENSCRFCDLGRRRPRGRARPHGPEQEHGTNLYCVLNPLTRTCVVLPPVPFRPQGWLPPAAGTRTVTVYGSGVGQNWEVATCDLAVADPRWTVLHKPAAVGATPAYAEQLVLAQCAGEIFWYRAGRVHVLAPPGGGGPNPVEAADALDGPSVALLGLDPSGVGYMDDRVFLVGHRGAVFLVAQPMRLVFVGATTRIYDCDPKIAAGVWRLERPRMAWEPVSLLKLETWPPSPPVEEFDLFDVPRAFVVRGAFRVRDLLCCDLVQLHAKRPHDLVLGLDLETGEWERVLSETVDGNPEGKCARPVDPRPVLFLS